jgi:hypothetical protein
MERRKAKDCLLHINNLNRIGDAVKINRAFFPKNGHELVVGLQGGPIFLQFSTHHPRHAGYPKIFITKYGNVSTLPPNLINVWVFIDEDTNGKIIGGISGPSQNHLMDWKKFEEAIDSLAEAEKCEQVISLLEEVSAYYLAEHLNLFQVT